MNTIKSAKQVADETLALRTGTPGVHPDYDRGWNAARNTYRLKLVNIIHDYEYELGYLERGLQLSYSDKLRQKRVEAKLSALRFALQDVFDGSYETEAEARRDWNA